LWYNHRTIARALHATIQKHIESKKPKALPSKKSHWIAETANKVLKLIKNEISDYNSRNHYDKLTGIDFVSVLSNATHAAIKHFNVKLPKI
jgi:hypothetical protein